MVTNLIFVSQLCLIGLVRLCKSILLHAKTCRSYIMIFKKIFTNITITYLDKILLRHILTLFTKVIYIGSQV